MFLVKEQALMPDAVGRVSPNPRNVLGLGLASRGASRDRTLRLAMDFSARASVRLLKRIYASI